MSTSCETSENRSTCDVVRLKVEGATTTVNTLRDQQTARGLSLVCPFPALEVDIPVMFGSGDDMQRGAIHRIGVEDDPRSGLPRLRLSVRAYSKTAETRATVVSPPERSLLGEASRATRVPAELDRASTDLDVVTEACDTTDLLDELLGGKRDRAAAGGSFDGLDPVAAKPDPEWAALGEIPMPGQLSARSTTRRRKRLASAAAWAMVIGFVAGGAWVLDRAGLVAVRDARQALQGLFQGTRAEPAAEPVGQVVAVATFDPEPATEPAIAPAAAPMMPEEPERGYWTGTGAVSPAVEEAATVEPPVEGSPPVQDEHLASLDETARIAADEPAATGSPNASDNDLVLVLPTRWPAEYSTAYRLRDPNGVVVDVPGALVRKEGWLDVGAGHPMIRSVKAMQRESGARFVIYVNGELPRFITAPKTGGIALRLFREESAEPVSTEQVAMAD